MYIKRIHDLLASVQADVVYITSPENMRYYSGFTGGEGVLILREDAFLLFTDSRYTLQAAAEATDFTIHKTEDYKPTDCLREFAPDAIGFESEFMTVAASALFDRVPSSKWIAVDKAIALQRAVKNEREQALTRQAAALADEAFQHVLPLLHCGMREIDVALELEFYMRKHGASGASFPIICASGARSALPHGIAGEKELEKGDFVTMDFGCFLDGYASDMTRTVVMGKADERQKEIYHVVLQAQETALASIRTGASCSATDNVARQVIKKAGYGDCFGHALGHGTGLAIHEPPYVSGRSKDVLKAGMTVTVEPGIYIENFGGVRIEDLVIVTEDGCENLTHTDKQLTEIV